MGLVTDPTQLSWAVYCLIAIAMSRPDYGARTRVKSRSGNSWTRALLYRVNRLVPKNKDNKFK